VLDVAQHPAWMCLQPLSNLLGIQERPEAGCGSCLEIECRDGRNVCYHMQPLTALVTDRCNALCNSTNINVSMAQVWACK
jgi:hypothetical protein